jgi:two-component system, LuxR family, response regulator FixJ
VEQRLNQLAPTVFIVDDDATTCRYFQALLATEAIQSCVMHTAKAFLDAYDPLQPGCVLLDVRLPLMSGLELQSELNRHGAVIPVIFVTAHANIPLCVEAMKEGAFGFLEKPVSNDALLAAVKAAFESDREIRNQLRAQESMAQRFLSLTPRENDVLLGLLSGATNKALAFDLKLSQRTIELHRARIMEKMGTRSLAQLARMAIDVGIGPAPQR